MNLRNYYRQFSVDILRLSAGTLFSQVIMLISAPFLSRLYSPKAFGLFGLFVAITNIATQISSLRYELAIMLPQEDKTAINVVNLALGLAFVFSIALFFVISLSGQFLATLFHVDSDFVSYLKLAPFGVWFGGALSVFNYWHSRHRNFGKMSIIRFFRTLTTVVVQIFVGYFRGSSPEGLIFGFLFGQVVAASMLLFADFRGLVHNIQIWGSLNEIKFILRRYRKFVYYNTPASLLNSLSWHSPSFFLAYFFSPVEVGYFTLAYRIIDLPMQLLGRSISRVFFQQASTARHQQNLQKVTLFSLHYLIKFSLFPFVIFMIVAPDLFEIVFGFQWREAGVYTQILLPWTFVRFLSSPISVIFSVLERQEWTLKLNTGILLARFVALLLGGLSGNARIMIALFSLSGSLSYSVVSVAALLLAGVRLNNFVHLLLRYGKMAFWGGSSILLLQLFIHWRIMVLTVALLSIGIYYYISFILFSPKTV